MPDSSSSEPVPLSEKVRQTARIQVAKLFRHRWTYFYVKSKLKTDPVYNAMVDVVLGSDLPLLDLGCGMGLFSFYLRALGFRPSIHGVDYDERKILTAQRLASRAEAGLEFAVADVRQGLPAHSGNVTILDILQYMTEAEQEKLLRAAGQRVAPGGWLLIRNCLKDDSRRFRWTRFTDSFAQGIRWIKPGSLHYPTRELICRCLEGAGLRGEVKPLWGGTPFNNYFFSYRREG